MTGSGPDYAPYPSVGRFESEQFDPITWRPHAPTAAYVEMLPDDAFWAARRVAAFDDDLIRALVHTGQFTDPAAERHLATVLIERRDKIARAYLPAVNALVNPKLDRDGTLTFDNAAVDARIGPVAAGYRTTWAEFDNATGETRPLGDARSGNAAIKAPRDLPSRPQAIVQIDVADENASHPPVRLHFRRTNEAWTLIGLERRQP